LERCLDTSTPAPQRDPAATLNAIGAMIAMAKTDSA
jgi:hypothetical protein